MEKPIIIFSHNFLTNTWRTIVGEQMDLLKRTGLYDRASQIHFGVYSEEFDNIVEFTEKVKILDQNSKCKIHVQSTNDNERPTLIKLQEVCQENPGAFVLYYHTKGVSANPFSDPDTFKQRTSWRHCMEYFCIEKWPRCVDLLYTHDCVGPLYANWSNHIYGFNLAFFSGNFWWATSDHINKTPTMHERDNWMDCETLITSIPHVYCNLYFPIPHKETVQGFLFDPFDYRRI